MSPSPTPFHLMSKPGGSACNLDCIYCFYLEKESLYPHSRRRMSDDVLEAYTRSYLQVHPGTEPVIFAWQGGEPTLMGLPFFERAIQLQRRYANGRTVLNTFQTNGVLLNDDWSRFLAHHKFLVGLSLDGPPEIHDHYRVSKSGKPTHADVMRGLTLLQRHRVDYNILACVNRLSARNPLGVYHFLKNAGVDFVQFIPIIERPPDPHYVQLGLKLSGPPRTIGQPASGSSRPNPAVTEWSVLPDDYGTFLCEIFKEWVKRDVGRKFVMNFEWALASYLGAPGVACHNQETCGRQAVIEHNGDVYSCDHFVYPEYRLGNILTDSLIGMIDSSRQKDFGLDKRQSLPQQCLSCKVLRACWGGCPKHRFVTTSDGEQGLHYLCSGYRQFFTYALPYLKVLADLLHQGRDLAEIMNLNIVVLSPPVNAAAS